MAEHGVCAYIRYMGWSNVKRQIVAVSGVLDGNGKAFALGLMKLDKESFRDG